MVLTSREMDVLLSVAQGRSLAESGRRLGLTRQRAHQLFWRACEKWPGVAGALALRGRHQWLWRGNRQKICPLGGPAL